MSWKLIKRLEKFRRDNQLSKYALCGKLGVPHNYIYRWYNTKKIIGIYKKVVEEFLDKNEDPQLVAHKQSNPPQSHSQRASDIAVVGIACYYPGASSIKELWENVLARRIQFRRMLDQRLPLSQYSDADAKVSDKTYAFQAAFIDNFEFNWSKWRIPKRTFESTDIVHWLALDTALKALDDARYKLIDLPLQNTGVIIGNTLTGDQTRSQSLRLRWPFVQKTLHAALDHLNITTDKEKLFQTMEKIYKSAFYPITEDTLAGGLANTIAGRICNYLNLKGGGYIVDGACSSSLLAIATAANALKNGDLDIVLAGGVDISLDPFELVGFAKAGALAKEKMCVYDRGANGFIPGEGCGFVVLKRLEDALKDKNYIYAVIKGWGISSDGKGGMMEPSTNGQALAIERAYKNLNYTPADINFVEGHGTGTAKGDRVELEGIAQAISKGKHSSSLRNYGVTSFKSIVGHTKAAAGVGGFIKAVLAVNQRILPPTANCFQPSEVFEGVGKRLYPIQQGIILTKSSKVRGGISSAGFGGINCHIAIESHDLPKEAIKSSLDEQALFVSNQETEMFVFTAKTTAHLKAVIQKFKEDLRFISVAEMADLAARLTKNVKQSAPIKIAIVADSPEHLYEALNMAEKELEGSALPEGELKRIKTNRPHIYIVISNAVKKTRVGFLYPGQGSQRLNMTRMLVERFQWAQDLLKISAVPLDDLIYKPLDKFLTREERQEFETKLSQTQITQPAIILSALLWTEFLSRLGIEPHAVGGHSLGELTAFYKAGALDKETLLRFAQLRGELMAQSTEKSGRMVSLFCSKTRAQELISKVGGNIVLANINSPNQMVVSGAKKEIDQVIALAQRNDISYYPLNVSNAFHSSFMKEASKKIASARFLPTSFKSQLTKLYSCMDGSLLTNKIDIRNYFARQVVTPVNFVELVESISKQCDCFIEVGPGRVLSDLVRSINKGKGPWCFPVESTPQNDRDLNVMLAELFVRGVSVNWEELYKKRLIRPFVPVSKRKFITNQCERPLKLEEQVVTPKPFEIKMVEQVIDTAKEFLQHEKKDKILPVIQGKDKIADLLVDFTQKMTGFDEKSITLDSRLLDDLNLDSIKAAELIAQAAKQLGIAGELDPSQFSNNTLKQIAERLHALVGQQASGQTESAENVFKRYQQNSWVRNFVVNFKLEEITTRNVNQFKAIKNVVVISEEGEEDLVKAITEQFEKAKGRVQKLSYEDLTDQRIKRFSKIDCLITVLPQKFQETELDKNKLKTIIERLQNVIQLAASDSLGKDSFVVFVGFGGGNFGENKDLENIESCCAKALASTLYLERPDLKVRVTDFDRTSPSVSMAYKIMDELQTYERFSAVGYDSKLIRKVIYYKNSQPAEYKKRNIQWSAKDVVLVTGGAKGITAQCALEFARATKVRMILVGRSPVPKNGDDKNEINEILKQFKKEKLNCHYYQCDVTDEKGVARIIQEIERKSGKITGVIHGAGLNSLKRLKQSSVQEAFQESLPKVIGAANVCKALANHPPKLIIGITSIIGLTGMEGSGWYGFANEILNLYLHQFKKQHSKTDVVTIAYSVWDEVGMGVKLGSVAKLSEKGISAIPVEEGIKRFRKLAEYDSGCQQVVVVARMVGIDTWKWAPLKANHFRFLEKIEYVLPNVELIARAHLNVKDDPYLLDHNWKGSLLFPLVFGLEAMTQAVAYVLGVDKFEQLKIKNINLERSISVPQEPGTTIEIHALVLEKETRSDSQQVKVEIYSEQTGFKEPHFEAIFDLGVEVKAEKLTDDLNKRSERILDIDPVTDLYGPILFQGKSFQCIDKIHELFYNEKTRRGECLLSIDHNKLVESFLKSAPKFNNYFLIGDPFFIDSVFQSMQLIIPQDLSLPRKTQEIEMYRINLKVKKRQAIVKSHIHKISDEQGIGNGKVYFDGNLTFEIKNCDLKILQTIVQRPSANDFVDPTQRDQKVIEEKLKGLAQEFGFIPPVVRCLNSSKLRNSKKDERHRIELPLIKQVIGELFQRNNQKMRLGNLRIKWLPSGKPVVEGEDFKGVNISVSHDGSFLMVVAGYGEQGCDAETIIKRDYNDWKSLLGNVKFNILRKTNSEFYDYIGTSIWATGEVISKSNDKSETFDLVRFLDGKYYIFKCNEKSIFNIIIPCTKKELVLSFLSQYKFEKTKDSLVNDLGYRDDYFDFQVEYTGPQKQLVTVKKFPITFKANKLKSKRVNFSSFFDWIGDIREFSILPIYDELTDILETGEWGISTNNVNLDIKGEIRSGDIVEARFWLDKMVTPSVFDLCYDFIVTKADNSRERVALATQRISWIKVLQHGIAKVDKAPAFFNELMDKMLPNTSERTKLINLKEGYRYFKLGNAILDNNITPNDDKYLSELVFDTCSEESNLVGNVYFSNYAKWISITTDRFFYKNWPEIYRGGRVLNEFVCTDCDIVFLNEAMPFDSIIVQMYLSELFDNGFVFKYFFYKDEKRVKLAVGELKLLWIKRSLKMSPSQDILPENIINKMRKLVMR